MNSNLPHSPRPRLQSSSFVQITDKGKDKAVPVHAVKTYASRDLQLYSFLMLEGDEVKWSASGPGCFTPEGTAAAYETGVDLVDSSDVAENIKSLDRVRNRTSIPWFSSQ